MKGFREENGRCFSGIQTQIQLRQGTVNDADPVGLPECMNAWRRRSSFYRFIPDDSRHNNFAEEYLKYVKNADAREVDERRAVGNDQHARWPAQRRLLAMSSSSCLKSSTSWSMA